MIFFLIVSYALKNFLDAQREPIQSAVLYLEPLQCYEIRVDSSYKVFLSDMTKADGLTLEIVSYDNGEVLRKFDDNSKLNGIFFQDKNLNNTRVYEMDDYEMRFSHEGQKSVNIALVFSTSVYGAKATINNHFSSFNFPIVKYDEESSIKFFNKEGFIFNEKIYSGGYLYTSIVVVALEIIITLFACCKKED